MEIYGDLYMLINGLADYMILRFTGLFLKRKVCKWRLVLSSFSGSLYALASLLISLPFLHAFFALLVSLLLVWMAFGTRGFFSAFLTFYLLSFFSGGAVTFFFSFFSAATSKKYALLLLMVLLSVTLFLLELGMHIYFSKMGRNAVTLLFEVEEEYYEMTALCDSGNLLQDPKSGLPVLLVDRKILKTPPPTENISVFQLQGQITLPYFHPTFLYINGIKKEACIALAEEGKRFGGHPALIPSLLLL